MLSDLKLMLGIAENEKDLDKKLELIIKNTTSRLKVLLGGIEPPEELGYSVFEVSVKRFNRTGSEGMTSHTVEGESTNYSDDDFAEFADDIQEFLDKQKGSTRGEIRWL